MDDDSAPKWEALRTEESRLVENVLRKEFLATDAYRYNAASLRVRIVDRRFSGLPMSERDDLVEPLIDKLPESTQRDIISLLLFSPDEVCRGVIAAASREFEEPEPVLP